MNSHFIIHRSTHVVFKTAHRALAIIRHMLHKLTNDPAGGAANYKILKTVSFESRAFTRTFSWNEEYMMAMRWHRNILRSPYTDYITEEEVRHTLNNNPNNTISWNNKTTKADAVRPGTKIHCPSTNHHPRRHCVRSREIDTYRERIEQIISVNGPVLIFYETQKIGKWANRLWDHYQSVVSQLIIGSITRSETVSLEIEILQLVLGTVPGTEGMTSSVIWACLSRINLPQSLELLNVALWLGMSTAGWSGLLQQFPEGNIKKNAPNCSRNEWRRPLARYALPTNINCEWLLWGAPVEN